MKVGDLLKVRACFEGEFHCDCFFCAHNSNRIGLVLARTEGGPTTTAWNVLFDCGEWEVFDSDFKHGSVEVISEHR
jgi:hypothetical protein